MCVHPKCIKTKFVVYIFGKVHTNQDFSSQPIVHALTLGLHADVYVEVIALSQVFTPFFFINLRAVVHQG